MTQEPVPEQKQEEAPPEQAEQQPAESEAPPAEAPAVVEKAKDEDENDWDDNMPITKEDWLNLGRYVISSVTTGIKKPIRRAGRAYINSAERATEKFVDGLDDKKKGD